METAVLAKGYVPREFGETTPRAALAPRATRGGSTYVRAFMSTERTSPETWPTLQRADAERVLRRAIEIEARGGEWMDGEQLRKVADAIDLDPRSVERALAEVAPPPAAPSNAPPADLPPIAEAAPARRSAAGGARPSTAMMIGLWAVMLSVLIGLLGLVLMLVGAMLDMGGFPGAAGTLARLGMWLFLAGILALAMSGIPVLIMEFFAPR